MLAVFTVLGKVLSIAQKTPIIMVVAVSLGSPLTNRSYGVSSDWGGGTCKGRVGVFVGLNIGLLFGQNLDFLVNRERWLKRKTINKVTVH